MRRTLLIISLFFTLIAHSQTTRLITFVTNSGFTVLLRAPADTSVRKPIFFYCQGAGEAGTDTSKYFVNGPFAIIRSLGWNPTDFWIAALQTKTSPASVQVVGRAVSYLLRGGGAFVDSNKFYLTGVSDGCNVTIGYIFSDLVNTGFYPKPAAMIPMSYSVTHNAVAENYLLPSIGAWGFGGQSDGHGISIHNWFVTYVIPGFPSPQKKFTFYVGGHGGWNTYYNPSYLESGLNVYQFAMQFKRDSTTPTPPSNLPPNANAGPNQSITIDNPATVNGSLSSDPEAGALTYLWSKVSGPAGGTPVTPTSVTSPLGTLTIAGTYVYQLIVTDPQGLKDTATTNVVVNDLKELPPVGLGLLRVFPCEYLDFYQTNDSRNKIWRMMWTGGKAEVARVTGFDSKVLGGSAGQYYAIVYDSLGFCYRLSNGNFPDTKAHKYDTDYLGASFQGITATAGWISENLAIKGGTIYSMEQDRFALLGTRYAVTAPRPLINPGKTFTQVKVNEQGIFALASDGTLWWYKDATPTPVQISTVRPAIGFGVIRNSAMIVIIPAAGQPTTSGEPWGFGDLSYLGSTGSTTTLVNLASTLNLGHYITKAEGSDNVMNYLTTNGDLFATGANSCGEIGNGQEKLNHMELVGFNQFWVYDYIETVSQRLNVTIPYLKATSVSDVWASSYFGFHYYYLTSDGVVHAGGRDKSYNLGTGRSNTNESAWPNALDKPSPVVSDWIYQVNNQFGMTKPTANAGADQVVTTTTANLSGSEVAGTSYSVASHGFRILSGIGTITNPTASSTTITGMANGIVTIQYFVTDNNGATWADTTQITANITTPNLPPVVSGGSNQSVTTSIATLNGSATDPDGIISTITWTQISGPSTANLGAANTAVLPISNLVTGVYVFQIAATDNLGAQSTATTQVTVNVACTGCMIRGANYNKKQ